VVADLLESSLEGRREALGREQLGGGDARERFGAGSMGEAARCAKYDLEGRIGLRA